MTPTGEPLRIAVVDRDSGWVQVLVRRLEHARWRVRANESPVPPEELAAGRLNAVVLDPAQLGPGGWEYLERISQALPQLGVLVATGPSSVAQRVRGLRLGADDWITKPCHPEEAVARLEAIVRRRRRAAAPALDRGPVVAGELEIRADQFQAYVAGRSIDLTRREFEVLSLLAEAGARVLPREEIYGRVWGYSMVHGDRSVDVFVRKLRHKIERASPGWRYIHTHFGVGYRFAPVPEDGTTLPPVAAGEAASDETRVGSPATRDR